MRFSDFVADMRPIRRNDRLFVNFDGVTHAVSGYYRSGTNVFIETGPLEELDSEDDITEGDFV